MRRSSNWVPIICIVVIFGGGFAMGIATIHLMNYKELASPSQRIKASDIQYYPDKVVIKVSNAWGTSYTNTQSMDPIIDDGMHGVVMKPWGVNDIHVGDVLSYKKNGDLIAHRVIKIDEDSDGWYALCKGDNNLERDPWKIRWTDVNGVLIALVY